MSSNAKKCMLMAARIESMTTEKSARSSISFQAEISTDTRPAVQAWPRAKSTSATPVRPAPTSFSRL